jgi:membrane associated rhomboid family serine protease
MTTLMTQKTAKSIATIGLPTVVAFWVGSLLVCVFVAWGRDWLVSIGAFWLGFVIGLLIGFFAQEAQLFDEKALTRGIGTIAGGGIFAGGIFVLLRFAAPDAMHEIWFYPMGLVGGFIVGTIWVWADPPDSRTRRTNPTSS